MSLKEKTKTYLECPKCHGTGIDPDSYDEHIMTGAFHIIARPCPKCKGTGKVKK